MKVEITRHAEQRIRERMGLNKKSIERMAQKAYDNGIKHSETKGRLRKYITKVYFQNENANNIRLYGNMLYIFSNERLITVFYLPRDLTKNLQDMVKREK